MDKIKTVAMTAVLALVPACQVFSAETTGAAFLLIPSSPRAYALGKTNVAPVGAQAIGTNPANLGLLQKRFEAFTSYATVMGGAQYQHLATAFAPSNMAADAFGVSVTRLQVGGLQGADASGNLTSQDFGSSDMAVALSGSGRLNQNLRVGVTAKALQSEIAGYKSKMSLASDLGMTYTFSQRSKPVSIGFSVTNLGQGIKFLDQTDPLPTALNMGLALPVGSLLAVFEVNHRIAQKTTEFGTGLEFGVGPVAFRGGYLMEDSRQNLAGREQKGAASLLQGLSCGFGIHAGAVSLDYAISQQAVEFGSTHRLALTVQWGGGAKSGRSARSDESSSSWKAAPDASDWLILPMGSY